MNGFEFDYRPGKVLGGPGCVDRVGAELAALGSTRALVVCGPTVGSTAAVMDPLRAGLGDALVGVFDGAAADKRLGTALAVAERAREAEADALVGVGGGAALDTARTAAALASHSDPRVAAERATESGSLGVAADGEPLRVAAVPTTLSGAELSAIAGTTLTLTGRSDAPSGSVSDPELMPALLCYDPELFVATPPKLRAASAMNGFDKAVEAVYSPYATPITDGTATHGIGLLRRHATALAAEDPDLGELNAAIGGIVCAQYGVSTPGRYKASIIHAFGHGFSHGYDVHQGVVHAAVAPAVLRFVFGQVEGRRELLADAFGADTATLDRGELATAVVSGVESVRDDLGLPARLRDVPGVERGEFPAVAAAVLDDGLLGARPEGVSVDAESVEAVLEDAW
jgi:alcohol dehydrogenase